MEELIQEIKVAYNESEKAFTHEPMNFDDRIFAMNSWWAAVTPEKVMRLVSEIEKGGHQPPLTEENKPMAAGGVGIPVVGGY